MIYHGVKDHSFEDLGATVERAVATLEPVRGQFDVIVATGVSGLVVAAPVAVQMGVPLVVVRKKDDQSTHSGRRVENMASLLEVGARWMFVDDFVATGHTLGVVRRALEEEAEASWWPAQHKLEFAGMYRYMDDSLRWGESA